MPTLSRQRMPSSPADLQAHALLPEAAGLRVAVVHDWLNGMRGGEKVLEAICALLPQAEIHTLLHDPSRVSEELNGRVVATSWLQRLPGVQRGYRYLLPLMPAAARSLDLSGYDLVLSSSHCVAKGVAFPETAIHVCYCHTPMRYIYGQFDAYFPADRKPTLRLAASLLRPWLTAWDRRTAADVGRFIANSANVRERIRQAYGREAEVIHPPVDVDFFQPAARKAGGKPYYLVAGALVPYKRVDLAIEACRRLGAALKIVGIGNESEELRKAAEGGDVEFLGWVAPERLRALYQGCEALLFPQEEDFGISAVEAMACGRPVIAYAAGGALETVVDGATGVLFREQTTQSLAGAIQRLRAVGFDPQAARAQAAKFGRRVFDRRLADFLRAALAAKTAV